MIGDRLKEERKRLGLSQEAFAVAAGVTRRPYAEWEAGGTSPTAVQLAALAMKGVDVQYVVTGRRSGAGIGESSVQQAVLDAIELLSLEKVVNAEQLANAVLKLVRKLSAENSPSAAESHTLHGAQIFHGDVGQQVKVEGNLDQRGISFSVGKKKK
ncbi:helix-turn-helix transcriptional regulator [Burkholderia cenocepacia]|nr:helix-turn-helix transcriptional regulator [Burkholderia cenocepacia]